MALADPALAALLDRAVPFALPLRREFRGLLVREGMLIKGPSGWGEFAPFDDYTDPMAARWLDAAVEAAFGEWPVPIREAVPVNAIIPAVPSHDAAVLTRAAVLEMGCTTIKIKVGGLLTDDEARVAAVRDVLDTVLGARVGRIRIDANAAWDVRAATTALRRLGAYGLEYVEQPCRTLEELRDVRAVSDVPIAVDEGIRTAADPASAPVREVADIAVVKPAPLGGVAATRRIVEALGMPVVVSGSLDSSVGLDVAIATAASLDQLPFACGFGTGALLGDDLVADTRLPREGRLDVARTLPDLDALMAARDRIDEGRAAYWRARLAAAWSAGAADRSGALVRAAL